MPKAFKILTHKPIQVKWVHHGTGYLDYLQEAPEFIEYHWCRRRKRFRESGKLAVGVPYDGWARWGKSKRYNNSDCIDFGKELAAQNGLHWIEDFNPSMKMKDLLLLRLKGKI